MKRFEGKRHEDAAALTCLPWIWIWSLPASISALFKLLLQFSLALLWKEVMSLESDRWRAAVWRHDAGDAWWCCMTHKNEDKIQIFFFPLLPLCMNFDTTGYTKRSWWTLWPASGVLWSLLVLYQLMALTTNFLLIQPSCSKPKECEMRHLCQRTKRQHLFFLIFFPIIAHI